MKGKTQRLLAAQQTHIPYPFFNMSAASLSLPANEKTNRREGGRERGSEVEKDHVGLID